MRLSTGPQINARNQPRMKRDLFDPIATLASALIILCVLCPVAEAVASGTGRSLPAGREFRGPSGLREPSPGSPGRAQRRPEPTEASGRHNRVWTSVASSGFCVFGLGEGVFVFMMLVSSVKTSLFGRRAKQKRQPPAPAAPPGRAAQSRGARDPRCIRPVLDIYNSSIMCLLCSCAGLRAVHRAMRKK